MYQRFAGIDGSAYFVGGLGMTALTASNIVVVPIRTGVGLRLGANVGYVQVHAHGDLEPVLSPFSGSKPTVPGRPATAGPGRAADARRDV